MQSYHTTMMSSTHMSRAVLILLLSVARGLSDVCNPGCTCKFDQAHMTCKGINIQPLPSTIPPSIRDLALHDCFLDHLEQIPANYSNLEMLTIMNSHVTTIAENAFEHLANVHSLSLTGNKIQKMDSVTLKGLTMLKGLTLHTNQIKRFEEDTFQYNPNLEYLVLSDNPELELFRRSFAQPENGTNKLYRIELRKCGLTDVPTSSICHSKVPGLTELDLSGNDLRNISEFKFKHAPGLKFLNLDSCQIPAVERETLGAMTKLETLILSTNMITRIDEQAFDDFYATMKFVHLEYNNLVSVKGSMFNFNTLHVLNVSYNPWECSCANGWLQQFPAKPNNTNHNITCASPEKFKDRNALSVMTKDVDDCGSDSGPNPMVAVYVAIPILIILSIVVVIIIVKICKLKKTEKRGSTQYSLVYKPTTEKA